MDQEETHSNAVMNKKCLVDQLQETVLDIDLSKINDSGIETKLCNIRNVTKVLIEKAKWIEERRKYLETVNWYLKNENADLLERCAASQNELKMMSKNIEEMKIEAMSNEALLMSAEHIRNYFRRPSLDKAQSCNILCAGSIMRPTVTQSTQTQDISESESTISLLRGFNRPRAQKSEIIMTSRHDNAPVIVMSKKELRRLDSNMESLRMKLAVKEEAWSKTAERERLQRFKMVKLSNEVTVLNKILQYRTQELSVKTRDLKMTKAQFEQAEREIKQLKKIILKTRSSCRECLVKIKSFFATEVVQTTKMESITVIAAIQQYTMSETGSSLCSRRKKVCSKKNRRFKEPGRRQSNTNTEMSQSHESLIGARNKATMGVQSYMTYDRHYPTVKRCRKFREEMTLDKLQRVESDTFMKTCGAS